MSILPRWGAIEQNTFCMAAILKSEMAATKIIFTHPYFSSPTQLLAYPLLSRLYIALFERYYQKQILNGVHFKNQIWDQKRFPFKWKHWSLVSGRSELSKNVFWLQLSTKCEVNGSFRATMVQTTMAHASMASALWRMPDWRRSSMAHSTMAQFQCGAFQYGAFQYVALPMWRCSSVSQFRRHVSMAHTFCLDNNSYINDLRTEHRDSVNVRCLITYRADTLVFGQMKLGICRFIFSNVSEGARKQRSMHYSYD